MLIKRRRNNFLNLRQSILQNKKIYRAKKGTDKDNDKEINSPRRCIPQKSIKQCEIKIHGIKKGNISIHYYRWII